jgi:hypothetical protein
MWTWTNWFQALSAEAKGEYKTRFPEPARWAGFYEFVETGKPNLALLKKSNALRFESDRVFEGGTSAKESGLQDISHHPLDRLVILLLREAITLGFSGIEIWDREPVCSIYYVRGDEKQGRDSPPRRLFHALRLRMARMCGIEDCLGTGTFATQLDIGEASIGRDREVRVSVDFGDSHMHLTILNP